MEEQTRPFLLPVEVQLEADDFFVVPGGNVEIRAMVKNHQQQDDEFELTVRGIPSDWVTIHPELLATQAGQGSTAQITIRPPALAAASTGVYPIVVRVVSRMDPGVNAEGSLDLRVAAYETGSRISILMDSLQYNVTPGSTVTIPFFLVNQGIGEDQLRLAVDGLPISWVSTSTPMLRLQPGERREVILVIQPPRSSQSRAGRTPFTIHVNSQLAPDQVSSVDCILTVAAFNQFSSDLNPPRIEPGQPARVRIFNQGNIQDVYTVRWKSQGGRLAFSTDQGQGLRVEPNEAAVVDFVANPVNRRIIGRPGVEAFTVEVQSSGGEVQTHSGDAVDTATFPVWVLPVLLILCLGLVCLTGWIWNRGRTQTANATLTVTAQTATVLAASQTASYNQTAAVLIGQEDTDGDGLTNSQEQELGTNPDQADTDSDRLLDGDEVRLGTNPLQPDSDGDGLLDGADIDPLDPNNPNITATALAGLPTPTETIVPENTATLTPETTDTPEPSEATATATEMQTPTSAPPALPANSALVFESNREGPSEIYSYISAFDAVPRLTISPSVDTQPAWSPDGSKIAFTSNRDGNNEIYVMNPDGTAVMNLSNHPSNDQFPAWSPDSSMIVFTSDRDGNQEIYVMQADGSNPQNLTNNSAQDLYPSWYQDGGLITSTNRIVFASGRDGNLEIYSMDPDGSNPTNLTNSPSNETFPAAPRSGGMIAFVSDRDGNAEIYVMNSDGSNPVNRTNNPAIDSYPSFLPDGSWMAFTTNRDVNQEIYVMRPDGSDLANLTRNPAEDLLARWR